MSKSTYLWPHPRHCLSLHCSSTSDQDWHHLIPWISDVCLNYKTCNCCQILPEKRNHKRLKKQKLPSSHVYCYTPGLSLNIGISASTYHGTLGLCWTTFGQVVAPVVQICTSGACPHQNPVAADRSRPWAHIVDSCPLSRFKGGFQQLHTADDRAVHWLETAAKKALAKWKKT